MTLLPTPRRRETFKNLASTDLMIRHLLKMPDGSELEHFEIGEVRRLAWYFERMETVLKRVAKGTQVAVLSARGHHWISKEAKDLWIVFRQIYKATDSLCSGRRLSPWLRVGLHLAKKWEPRLRWRVTSSGFPDIKEDYCRRALDHLLAMVRRAGRNPKFRRLNTNHVRNARENYISSCNYLLDIWSAHPRTGILRIDCYIEGVALEIANSEEVNKAYDKFIADVSAGRIIEYALGYVAKREAGLERRIHFHVLVVIDSNMHHHAYELTQQLGRHWVDNCVGSRSLASFENCYLRKDEYEFNCLGKFDTSDEDMLKGLRKALKYLCDESAYVLVDTGMGRNFRKGQSPKFDEEGRRVGAPRKYQPDLRLARKILFGK